MIFIGAIGWTRRRATSGKEHSCLRDFARYALRNRSWQVVGGRLSGIVVVTWLLPADWNRWDDVVHILSDKFPEWRRKERKVEIFSLILSEIVYSKLIAALYIQQKSNTSMPFKGIPSVDTENSDYSLIYKVTCFQLDVLHDVWSRGAVSDKEKGGFANT